jgi:hydroxyacylglutathione hydrolase
MPLEIVTVPCRSDNYAFLIHDDETGKTALVDAPEAAALDAALKERGWGLDELWITHHHTDHVEGVEALRRAYGCAVTGAAADEHRLPALDRKVQDGESFEFAGNTVEVMDVSGHTVGHIAFHIPAAHAAFTADSLMALGCGRVFEGTFEQMWASLSKLAALPPETVIHSGHEYTEANARFAATIEPDNEALISRRRDIAAARAAGKPTVPSLLSEELATNPFLRAGEAEVKSALGMQGANDAEVFGEIRSRKDRF